MPKKLINETYQAVSRGLIEHYKILSDPEAKLFSYLLLVAIATGKHKGFVFSSALEMSKELGWKTDKLYYTLKTEKISKYIEVEYAKSRHRQLVIKIKNFKNINDFYYPQKSESKHNNHPPDSEGTTYPKIPTVKPQIPTVKPQIPTVTSVSDKKNNDLQTPKKNKRIKEINNYMLTFDKARSQFLGNKRGLKTEFDNFQKKHSDWKTVLPLLLPAIEREVAHKESLKRFKQFCPEWKNFKTWINQRCWEEEFPVNPEKTEDKCLDEYTKEQERRATIARMEMNFGQNWRETHPEISKEVGPDPERKPYVNRFKEEKK